MDADRALFEQGKRVADAKYCDEFGEILEGAAFEDDSVEEKQALQEVAEAECCSAVGLLVARWDDDPGSAVHGGEFRASGFRWLIGAISKSKGFGRIAQKTVRTQLAHTSGPDRVWAW